MDFFTTKYINDLIKDEYIAFIHKYYTDILSNPNKYINLVERKILDYLWWGYVKLLGSGTTALQFWLLSLWVWKWDEVILPANTYSATAIAVTNVWAVPVFADINLNNYTIDSSDIERKVTSRTKVIIPVHLYGYSCYMDEILEIAKKHKIKILEDASHSFWGEYKGEKLWTIWNIWAFSCHFSKNFWTFGNWWIFYTKDKELFYKIDDYMFPDRQNKDVLKSWRTPATIWVMEALVLFFKLKYIDKIIDWNKDLFLKYLKELWNDDNVISLPEFFWWEHIRNFTCLVKDRERLLEEWKWKVYYDIDLSESVMFKDICKAEWLDNTKYFFENCFSYNFYYWIEK